MTIYAERARYVPVEKGFNITRPAIEPMAFVSHMARAFADDTPTSFIPLDLSETLGTTYPATTPFMLIRYSRIRGATHSPAHWPRAGKCGRCCVAEATSFAAARP